MLVHVHGPAGSGRTQRALGVLSGLPGGLTVVVDPCESWTEAMVSAIGGPVVVLRRAVACSEDLDSVIGVLGSDNAAMRVLVDDVEQTCLGRRRWNALASVVSGRGGALVIVTPDYFDGPAGVPSHLASPVRGRHRALFYAPNS